MTTLAGASAGAEASSVGRPPRSWWRRPVPAALVLLAIYVVLAFLNDSRGYLGTDTGIKVATLQTMAARGSWVPDIGYWAATWDPEATAHPFRDTTRIGDAYVDVTTLPMLYAAYPLWRIGGYRAALALPMAGAVAAAFVARALARRLGDRHDGWPAFWLTGLASPLAIYALDLWEHAIGVALLVGGVLLLFDVAHEPDPGSGGARPNPRSGPRSGPWPGLGRSSAAGAAVGLAYTMRTEALVYGFAAFALTGVATVARTRRVGAPVRYGVAGLAGFALVAAANARLEILAVGQTIRSARASGTAAIGGSGMTLRLREGIVTLTSPFPTFEATYVVLGVAAAACLVAAAGWAGAAPTRSRAAIAAAGVAVVAVVRLADGPGFWPGLLATTPVAGVALARGWRDERRRYLLAVALGAVPLVILFQFTGGALPQWGGRYLLTSGLLLAIVGSVALDELEPWARRGVVALAAVVTVAGLVWLNVRSHQVAAALGPLRDRPEPVLIWSDGFLPREFAAMYGERDWLAAASPSQVADPARVAARAGRTRLGLVSLGEQGTDAGPAPVLPGYHVTGRSTTAFLDPVVLVITSYEAGGADGT